LNFDDPDAVRPAPGTPGLKSLVCSIDGAEFGCAPLGSAVEGNAPRKKLVELCPEFCATAGAPAGLGTTIGATAVATDFGAPLDPTGAVLAKFEIPGVVSAAGCGTNVEVDTGLLLNRMLAALFGAAVDVGALVAGCVVAAGPAGAAVEVGALGTTAAGRDG
jgi:hypothetical protein